MQDRPDAFECEEGMVTINCGIQRHGKAVGHADDGELLPREVPSERSVSFGEFSLRAHCDDDPDDLFSWPEQRFELHVAKTATGSRVAGSAARRTDSCSLTVVRTRHCFRAA